MCALEYREWCSEPYFADPAISIDGFLPKLINQCLHLVAFYILQEFICTRLVLPLLYLHHLCGLVPQGSWLKIQRSGFDSRSYEIFWKVVRLERGPLSLVSTTDKLLGRDNNSFGLESQEYGRGDPLRWPRDVLYPQKLVLNSPTSGGRLACILRWRTKATEFVYYAYTRDQRVRS
jgi:hypothetical protein